MKNRSKSWVRPVTFRFSRGFTLIEMVIVVVVLGVALVVAVPSFADLVRNQRLTGAANDLVGALARARSEAVAAGAQTVLCPSGAPADSDPCTGGTDYAVGWIVAVDADGDGAIDIDAGDRLVRAWQGVDFPVDGFEGPSNVTYGVQGLKTGNAIQNFFLQAAGCGNSGNSWQRRIRVNPIGNFDTQVEDC